MLFKDKCFFTFYCRLEIVGKFPTAEVSTSMKINENIPVWLPVGSDSISPDLKVRIKNLRKAVNHFNYLLKAAVYIVKILFRRLF